MVLESSRIHKGMSRWGSFVLLHTPRQLHQAAVGSPGTGGDKQKILTVSDCAISLRNKGVQKNQRLDRCRYRWYILVTDQKPSARGSKATSVAGEAVAVGQYFRGAAARRVKVHFSAFNIFELFSTQAMGCSGFRTITPHDPLMITPSCGCLLSFFHFIREWPFNTIEECQI